MKTVRFGELYAIPSGNGLSRPRAVRGEGYRMIGMGELFSNDIITDIEMERVQMSERELNTFLVEEGDLLFARQSLVASGAGKCSIVKTITEPTTYESHIIRIRLDKIRCNSWFFYYFFKLPNNPIKAIVNQCAQAGIRGNELVKVKVPLPKRDIQDRIASILSAYDNLIEVNNKRIKVLEQMAENLYKEWFVRFRFPGYKSAEFENGIPKGWGIDSVKETFEIFDTIRIPLSSIERDNMQKVYPYYGAAEILDYVEDYLFDGIYLLLGEDGSVMTPDGKPMLQYVWGQFWVNNHAHVLQGKLPFTTEFIYLMFKNTNVTGIVTGSAQPKISQGRLFKKKTIIPPSHIVEQFNRIITPLFDNIRSLSEINKNLIKQRDLLLPRLMSGKLEV